MDTAEAHLAQDGRRAAAGGQKHELLEGGISCAGEFTLVLAVHVCTMC